MSSRPGARDTIPPTEVGVHGPIAHGSMRIAGDALLEVKQLAEILAAIVSCRAIDVGNSVTQQQQRQHYVHSEFRRLLG